MTKSDGDQWRDRRRTSARRAILEAAWELAHDEGLLGWSLRDLAKQAGITPPTVYAYFESKNAIYDAMFGQAAEQFDDYMGQPFDIHDPREHFIAYGRRFFAFCTSDPVRYQLLFQRTIPDFQPSAESFAPSVRALDRLGDLLAANGITEPRHRDLWTGLATGLVSQQVSNDPGGTRWSSLTEEAVDMLLAHCQAARESRTATSRPRRRSGATT
jgi:AcrR family transcriptional regulator